MALYRLPRRSLWISTNMTVCIILNPQAGTAEQAHVIRQAVVARSDLTLWETTSPGQARELAATALRAGAELNQVVVGADYTPVVPH
jgi:diacylglycerol kinase family enzyme